MNTQSTAGGIVPATLQIVLQDDLTRFEAGILARGLEKASEGGPIPSPGVYAFPPFDVRVEGLCARKGTDYPRRSGGPTKDDVLRLASVLLGSMGPTARAAAFSRYMAGENGTADSEGAVREILRDHRPEGSIIVPGPVTVLAGRFILSRS